MNKCGVCRAESSQTQQGASSRGSASDMVRHNLPHHFRRFLLSLLAIAVLPMGGWAQRAVAQEVAVPEPAEVRLESVDGVSKLVMHCTYYQSPLVADDNGKSAIPILLLHGRGGTRGDDAFLAKYLQEQGHAVLVPDLRGHGDSSELIVGAARVKLNPDKMKKPDFNLMVKDLEAVKSWLLEMNNAEELNMELLVVVGSDMSSVTAMNFAL